MRDQVTVRVEPALTARIDAYVDDLRNRTGLRIPRTEAIRKLLGDALTAAGFPEQDDAGAKAVG